MATLATVFGRFMTKAAEQEEAAPRVWDASTRLRAFANEDVLLFVKHIDNSRVVRSANPESGRQAWKAIGTMVAAVVLVIMVLMPSAYGRLAGYQIEKLRLEGEKLAAQHAQLVLEEAALLNPERMRELARQQAFIDPGPERIVRLDQAGQDRLATAAAPVQTAK